MLDRSIHLSAPVGGYPLAQSLLGILRDVLGVARGCRRVARFAAGEQSLHGLDHLGNAERLLDVLLDAIILLQVFRDTPAAVDRAHHDDRNVAVLGASLDASRDV